MIRLALAALATLATGAQAQIVSPRDPASVDLTGYATTAQLGSVQSLIPAPAATIPPAEAIGGTVGTAGTYRPADSAIPRITRAAVVTTDAAGAWSVTWSSALPAMPVVLPIAINASTSQPVVCNVATRSTTAASGRCWTSQQTVLSLGLVTAGLTLLPFANAAASTSVQIIAIPPTQ